MSRGSDNGDREGSGRGNDPGDHRGGERMPRDYGCEKPVYIVCGYTDLRQGIDGLAKVITDEFELDPFQEALFLFCGRRQGRTPVAQGAAGACEEEAVQPFFREDGGRAVTADICVLQQGGGLGIRHEVGDARAGEGEGEGA